MRPGILHRLTHACGHAAPHWLDVGDDWLAEQLELQPCPACERQAEWDAHFAAWLAEED